MANYTMPESLQSVSFLFTEEREKSVMMCLFWREEIAATIFKWPQLSSKSLMNIEEED